MSKDPNYLSVSRTFRRITNVTYATHVHMEKTYLKNHYILKEKWFVRSKMKSTTKMPWGSMRRQKQGICEHPLSLLQKKSQHTKKRTYRFDHGASTASEAEVAQSAIEG